MSIDLLPPPLRPGGLLLPFFMLFALLEMLWLHRRAEAGRGYDWRESGASISHNPLRIAFGEWSRLLADMRKAGGLRRALRQALAPPG
jgi:hypothetical protein